MFAKMKMCHESLNPNSTISQKNPAVSKPTAPANSTSQACTFFLAGRGLFCNSLGKRGGKEGGRQDEDVEEWGMVLDILKREVCGRREMGERCVMRDGREMGEQRERNGWDGDPWGFKIQKLYSNKFNFILIFLTTNLSFASQKYLHSVQQHIPTNKVVSSVSLPLPLPLPLI